MKFGEKRGEVIRMDTYNMIDFNEKKGFICDMDGVIYHGNRVLPGVAEFIQWLHDENKEYLFLTNNSGYTPRELSQKLARMGLDVTEEHFYTSALATAAFLRDQAPGCSVFAIGEAGLLNALYDAGITMNDVNPDYVVVGEGRSYSLDTLTKATNLVWKGAKLIGANSDVSGPIENGIVPACRALVAPIEMATGTQAYFCGKPNPLMMRTGLRMLHCHSAEAVMVGDRMDTDVISGMESGMSTVLVLSGVSTRETIKTYAYRPSMVLNGVGDIVSLARGEKTEETYLQQMYENYRTQYEEEGENHTGAYELVDETLSEGQRYDDNYLVFNGITLADDEYVSLHFNDTVYYAGAAHPLSYYIPVTISVATGEEVTPEEVLGKTWDEIRAAGSIEEENEENFNADYGFYITEKELCYLYRTNFFVEEIRISR